MLSKVQHQIYWLFRIDPPETENKKEEDANIKKVKQGMKGDYEELPDYCVIQQIPRWLP